MRFVVGLLTCLTALTAAFAEPPPPASSPATTAPSTPPAATPAAPPAKPAVDPDVQHFTQEGFRPEMRHGVELYCRKEIALGSRLATQKTCGTIEELKLMERRTRADVEESQKRQSNSPK